MSQILLAANQQAAQQLADRAQLWLQENVNGYNASAWDQPRYNAQTDQWGIIYPDYAAAAFTADDLGTGTVGTGEDETVIHANLAEFTSDFVAVEVPPPVDPQLP